MQWQSVLEAEAQCVADDRISGKPRSLLRVGLFSVLK